MVSRVVLLHGFTQTSASWPPVLIDALERAGDDVLALDAPGHGTASEVHVDLTEAARLASAHGPAHFVGYSMGGRVALHVALNHPHAVEKLVLIGATPGIEDDAERGARREADEELAVYVETNGVEAFLDRWLANPLFATLPPDAAGREARLANTAAGLAASLRLMGTGMQAPLWDRLATSQHDALFITGERDEKFTDLARRMARSWGGTARVDVVPSAGHAAHLERPDDVAARIVRFLHPATSAAESTTP